MALTLVEFLAEEHVSRVQVTMSNREELRAERLEAAHHGADVDDDPVRLEEIVNLSEDRLEVGRHRAQHASPP
jgi:hypothetical protein